ncbi:hypothetical protein RUM43_009240 [Polyplax serrata]|uniref:Uncharacterized protein n=1 Tax=Polyplax serrata TaxID=468196 RepID=A0AAN8S1Z5_POLSC
MKNKELHLAQVAARLPSGHHITRTNNADLSSVESDQEGTTQPALRRIHGLEEKTEPSSGTRADWSRTSRDGLMPGGEALGEAGRKAASIADRNVPFDLIILVGSAGCQYRRYSPASDIAGNNLTLLESTH